MRATIAHFCFQRSQGSMARERLTLGDVTAFFILFLLVHGGIWFWCMCYPLLPSQNAALPPVLLQQFRISAPVNCSTLCCTTW
jgi:hypothetical protein